MKTRIKHLLEIPFRVIETFTQIFPNNSTGCKIRGLVYKTRLKKCGNNFQVSLGVRIENPRNLEIGDDVFVGNNSWINAIGEGITLESEVMIGPSVNIVSNNHGYDYKTKSSRFASGISKHINIGKGVWLGSGVFVGSGVEIGHGSIVGANSTVVKSLPSLSLSVGSPAKVVRSYEESN